MGSDLRRPRSQSARNDCPGPGSRPVYDVRSYTRGNVGDSVAVSSTSIGPDVCQERGYTNARGTAEETQFDQVEERCKGAQYCAGWDQGLSKADAEADIFRGICNCHPHKLHRNTNCQNVSRGPRQQRRAISVSVNVSRVYPRVRCNSVQACHSPLGACQVTNEQTNSSWRRHHLGEGIEESFGCPERNRGWVHGERRTNPSSSRRPKSARPRLEDGCDHSVGDEVRGVDRSIDINPSVDRVRPRNKHSLRENASLEDLQRGDSKTRQKRGASKSQEASMIIDHAYSGRAGCSAEDSQLEMGSRLSNARRDSQLARTNSDNGDDSSIPQPTMQLPHAAGWGCRRGVIDVDRELRNEDSSEAGRENVCLERSEGGEDLIVTNGRDGKMYICRENEDDTTAAEERALRLPRIADTQGGTLCFNGRTGKGMGMQSTSEYGQVGTEGMDTMTNGVSVPSTGSQQRCRATKTVYMFFRGDTSRRHVTDNLVKPKEVSCELVEKSEGTDEAAQHVVMRPCADEATKSKLEDPADRQHLEVCRRRNSQIQLPTEGRPSSLAQAANTTR